MRLIQNIISIVASYAVGISALYLVQYYTIGLIPVIKHWMIGRLVVKDLLFLIVAIILFVVLFDVHPPH